MSFSPFRPKNYSKSHLLVNYSKFLLFYSRMVSTVVIIAIIIAILFVAGVGLGFIPLNFQGGIIGGVPQPQPPAVVGTEEFTGELDIILQHFDTLDNQEERIEKVDLTTTFYKSSDEVRFSTIGEGVAGATRVTITSDMNNILYASVGVLDPFFVDPQGTQSVNERISFFFFRDVSNDGIKEWIFKTDLRGIPIAVAGQDASTIPFFTNSYDIGTPSLNAPTDIFNLGSDSGTVTFVRWELTQPQETASAQTEYQIKIEYVGSGQGGRELWDLGQSTLDIPNIGLKSLIEFDETIIGTTNATYKFRIQSPDGSTGSALDSANYIATPQNGNDVIPIPFKIVTSLQDNAVNDNLDVTLTIKHLNQFGGSATSITDTIRLDES